MKYIKFEIVIPPYSLDKRIKSPNLREGDRFILPDSNLLFYKTDLKSKDGQYLCCNDGGSVRWLDGDFKVKKINGVVNSMQKISASIKRKFESK